VSQRIESSDFSGRTILVTGASSGIGLATSELLENSGAKVLRIARSFAGETQQTHGETSWFQADVRKRDTLQGVASTIERHHGKLDGVFINAGIAEFVALDALDESHIERVIGTNVVGTVLSAQAFVPLIRRGGSVVLTSSVAASVGAPWCSVYSASKGAVESMARSLAAELLPNQVRVNCVSPGPTETPILAKSALSEEGAAKLAPFVMQRMRMGRLGTALEIAEAVAFLLSHRSAFITGQTLAVDGGLSGI
jgi:NAD(P)-dependent dehydrogenase (short-subunit alcohol dehydrogenase family)